MLKNSMKSIMPWFLDLLKTETIAFTFTFFFFTRVKSTVILKVPNYWFSLWHSLTVYSVLRIRERSSYPQAEVKTFFFRSYNFPILTMLLSKILSRNHLVHTQLRKIILFSYLMIFFFQFSFQTRTCNVMYSHFFFFSFSLMLSVSFIWNLRIIGMHMIFL